MLLKNQRQPLPNFFGGGFAFYGYHPGPSGTNRKISQNMERFFCICLLLLFPLAQVNSGTIRGHWVELSAGTPVMLVLNQALDAEGLMEGQTLNCKIRQDVVFNQQVLIAHGTAAYARIVAVETKKRKIRSVLVELISTQATDGQTINLHSPFINIQVHDNPGALNMLLQGFVLDNTRIKV